MASSKPNPQVGSPHPVPSDLASQQEPLDQNDDCIPIKPETDSSSQNLVQQVSATEGIPSQSSDNMIRRTPPPIPPRIRSDTFKSQSSHSSTRRDSVDYESSKSRKQSKSRTRNAILVMGSTGAGKSSFISCATGKPVKIGHSLDPCTVDPEAWEYESEDGRVTILIDTPGFNDIRRSDMDLLTSIVDFIVDNELKVIAVIYPHRITERKLTGSTMINLRMLRAVCGDHFLRNVILVSSMWSVLPPDEIAEACRRETEFVTAPDFWGDMLEKGAKYLRWDETEVMTESKTAADIVGIVQGQEKHDSPMLNILLEIKKRMTVEETTAGTILTEEIRKRTERERRALEEEEDIIQEDMKAIREQKARLEAEAMQEQNELRREQQLAAQNPALAGARHAYASHANSSGSRRIPSPPPIVRRWSEGFHNRLSHLTRTCDPEGYRRDRRSSSIEPVRERYRDEDEEESDAYLEEEERRHRSSSSSKKNRTRPRKLIKEYVTVRYRLR